MSQSIAELINDPNTNLIDVRTPAEVAEVSIEGAINIPLDQIPDRLEEFKNMEGPIVLFCRSGNRSGNAMGWLNQQGLGNLHNAGGYADVKLLKGI